ncbi:hypothetical protein HAX54_017871 [Datura stramonium]|uniref:Uncharacterized protein n=1 Tax=Datura stramonium TaxID=4076 RepID=A0ABS8ULD3_DATST|nr:hypothetical protein [Datura stramonium]
MSEHSVMDKKETAFALAALMEIPFQYRATQRLQFRESKRGPRTRSFPPPREVIDHDSAVKSLPHVTSYEPVDSGAAEQVCPICLTNPKDMAFGCGHLVSDYRSDTKNIFMFTCDV